MSVQAVLGWLTARGVVCAAVLAGLSAPARAVPSFAAQTGQPCTTCHIGAFGPQLTPFGRSFKIGGYTQTGGEGWAARFPVSAMIFSSFSNTAKKQDAAPYPHYADNNNFAADQIALFVGGRITSFAGALIQGTFNGITSSFNLDNSDVKLTTPVSLGGSELQIGLDVNNGPTVQDPFNTTYAWGFPYFGSKFAPTPTAQPLLAGGLIGNSIGATVYAWYDRSLYLEAGLYNTYGPSLLSGTGNRYGPGSTANPSPYARVAYEWNWNGQSAQVGGIFLHSNINPATAAFSADGSQGHDSYTDYAIDGGYQYLGDGTHTVSILGIFDHEQQKLTAGFNSGAASQSSNSLNQLRANVSYYYQQTYGATVGWQKTFGSANPLLYPAGSTNGSANGKPDSNAYILEADYVPFGKAGSWGAPFANLKVGVQYTGYTQFNGGGKNYDGFGRNASDDNTIYVFAWFIF